MTDAERIENLERENHELHEQVKAWKDACFTEFENNRKITEQLNKKEK